MRSVRRVHLVRYITSLKYYMTGDLVNSDARRSECLDVYLKVYFGFFCICFFFFCIPSLCNLPVELFKNSIILGEVFQYCDYFPGGRAALSFCSVSRAALVSSAPKLSD